MANLNNWGDLKALILQIKSKQRNQKIISKGKEFALDQVLGFIPGASSAKTLFDFINAARSKPDTKKTDTWLDRLDMDDEMLKIIDDAVENGFIEFVTKMIESKPDNEELPEDFSMDDEMMKYLKGEYRNRTVVGYQESKGNNKMNTKANLLKTLIREEIKRQLKEMSDPDAVQELVLYSENDSKLYNVLHKTYVPALNKFIKKGNFDEMKAIKLLEYYLTNYVRPSYKREFGDDIKLNPADRKAFAKEILDSLKSEGYISY